MWHIYIFTCIGQFWSLPVNSTRTGCLPLLNWKGDQIPTREQILDTLCTLIILKLSGHAGRWCLVCQTCRFLAWPPLGWVQACFRCHWFISISAHSWVNGGILREFSLLSRRLQRQRAATTRSRAHVWNATITSRLVLCRKVGKVWKHRAASNNDQVLNHVKWTLLNVSDLGTGYLVGTEKMFQQQPGMSG